MRIDTAGGETKDRIAGLEWWVGLRCGVVMECAGQCVVRGRVGENTYLWLNDCSYDFQLGASWVGRSWNSKDNKHTPQAGTPRSCRRGSPRINVYKTEMCAESQSTSDTCQPNSTTASNFRDIEAQARCRRFKHLTPFSSLLPGRENVFPPPFSSPRRARLHGSG